MLWLAIDSACDRASIALVREAVLTEEELPLERRLCAQLMPALERLLAEAKMDWREVEAIAVDIGPGRFTSLRIGIATAKALAWSLRLPLVGVSSLEILASGSEAGPPVSILAVLKAPQNRFFAAGYRKQEDLQELLSPRLLSGDELRSVLLSLPEPRQVIGEVEPGAAPEAETVVLPAPRAKDLAWRARELHARGVQTDPLLLQPFYLAPPAVTLPSR